MSDTRSFITTRPKCARCPRCGRLQLTGHAEGIAYRVDPFPVTLHGELAARQSGRWTYALIVDALAYRSPSRIGGDARRPRPPVLAAHRCEHPPEPWCVDAAHVEAISRFVDRAQRRDDDSVPAPLSESEFDALFTLGRELGATVLATEFDPHTVDPPPF